MRIKPNTFSISPHGRGKDGSQIRGDLEAGRPKPEVPAHEQGDTGISDS